MIENRNIICIASNWWYDPTSKHHLMKLLARHNHVVWVNYHGSRRPRLSAADVRTALGKLRLFVQGPRRGDDNITVITPILVPVPGSAAVAGVNRRLLVRQVRAVLRTLPARPVQLWSFAPDVDWLCGQFDEECIVYYCVDEFSAFSGYDRAAVLEAEARLAAKADLVVTTSRALYDAKRQLNPNTALITHGVDYEHFAGSDRMPRAGGVPPAAIVPRAAGEPPAAGVPRAACPPVPSEDSAPTAITPCHPANDPEHSPPTSTTADVWNRIRRSEAHPGLKPPGNPASLPRPILGFWGLLQDWLDVDLLAEAAAARPQWSIVLIGEEVSDLSRLRAQPNVYFLGRRPYAALPAYAAAFDVGIIPFRVNELTRAVNPIKLREYLVVGLPVVSTPLPEVKQYSRFVRVASNAIDFVAACEAAIAEDSPAQAAARRDAMRSESWESKAAQVSALVQKCVDCGQRAGSAGYGARSTCSST